MRERLRVFVAVFLDPNLRRIELAFAGFNMAEYATWIAILVFAYERGGPTAAGIVALIQLVPAALVAPFASFSGDRFRKDGVLFAGYVIQAVSMGGTATAILLEAPLPVIYGGAIATAMSFTLTRPAQASLLPVITRSPEDLTAANVASGVIESIGIFAGPLIAGVILRIWGVGTVFAFMGVLTLGAALLTWRLKVDRDAVSSTGHLVADDVWREILAGFRVLREERDARLLVMVICAQILVVGALDVLFVAGAIDLLGLGQGGAGFLTAAFGAGGIVGAGAAVMLVGRRRLTPPLAFGAVVFGAPLMVMGGAPTPYTASLLIAIGGSGRSLSDVSGRTLLQRVAPDDVLARVFGVLEGMMMLALAIGSIGAAVLVAHLGIRTALIVTGAFVPAAILLALHRLLSIDAAAKAPDPVVLALLQRIPIFSPLPAPAVERVMAELTMVVVGAGEIVIRQGDSGDRFYVIAEGEAEVTIDGRQEARFGPGDWFGEIALLREVPRTATVRARTSMTLYALERDPFIEAVTGHPRSIQVADEVVRARLGT